MPAATIAALLLKHGDDIETGIKFLGAALNIFNKHQLSEERIKVLLEPYRDENGDVVREPSPDEVQSVIDQARASMKARWGDE